MTLDETIDELRRMSASNLDRDCPSIFHDNVVYVDKLLGHLRHLMVDDLNGSCRTQSTWKLPSECGEPAHRNN